MAGWQVLLAAIAALLLLRSGASAPLPWIPLFNPLELALLAAMLLPALGRGKARAQATACANSLRQLGIAFHLYLHDNADVFPTAASRSGLGAQPEDWVWWQVEAAPTAKRREGYMAALEDASVRQGTPGPLRTSWLGW